MPNRWTRQTLLSLLFFASFWSCVPEIAGQTPRLRPDELHISSRAYQIAPPKFVSNVTNVPLEVVVRGSNGLPVAGLGQDNFRVLDNGQPRPLTAFSIQRHPTVASPVHDTSPTPPVRTAISAAPPLRSPRNLALYFDDVNTDHKELDQARIAALRFLREASNPSDQIALFTASASQSVAFSRDRRPLLASLAAVRSHPRAAPHTDGCLRITDYQAYLIVNHLDPSALSTAIGNQELCNAQIGLISADVEGLGVQKLVGDSVSEVVFATADTIWNNHRAIAQDTLHSIQDAVSALAHQPGTRILLLASSGFLAGTLENQQDDVIQQALRDQVTINALDARGLFTVEPTIGLDETTYLSAEAMQGIATFQIETSLNENLERESPMANLALSTGGLIFHNNNDLTLGFRRLGLAPDVAYEIAFSPTNVVHDGKFHRLEVQVRPDHHYIVQARRGYFAPAPAATAADWSATDAAMRSPTASHALPVEVTVRPRAATLVVNFHLTLAQPPFRHLDGRERDDLLFTVGLFTPQGAYLTGKQAEMRLALRDASWRALSAQGLNAGISLPARPGSYNLRFVVEDGNQARLFSLSYPVTVR